MVESNLGVLAEVRSRPVVHLLLQAHLQAQFPLRVRLEVYLHLQVYLHLRVHLQAHLEAHLRALLCRWSGVQRATDNGNLHKWQIYVVVNLYQRKKIHVFNQKLLATKN